MKPIRLILLLFVALLGVAHWILPGSGSEDRKSGSSLPVGFSSGHGRQEVTGGSDRTPPEGSGFTFVDPDLSGALMKARHLVHPLTRQQAAMKGNEGVVFFADQPGELMTVRFGSKGVELRPDQPFDWQFGLELSGAVEQLDSDKVGYRRGPELEWFRNTPEGLEHGMTLSRKPRVDDEDWVTLPVKTWGDLDARMARDSSGDLVFVNEAEEEVLRYSDLKVWDARGRELVALMRPRPDGFAIAYQDQGAVYPVTIDPTFRHTLANFSREVEIAPFYFDDQFPLRDRFGQAVAISDQWAFISNDSDNGIDSNDTGAVYVFRRTSGGWDFRQRLINPDAMDQSFFGRELILFEDQLYVGAPSGDRGRFISLNLKVRDGSGRK